MLPFFVHGQRATLPEAGCIININNNNHGPMRTIYV
jgi:hypothetical protein